MEGTMRKAEAGRERGGRWARRRPQAQLAIPISLAPHLVTVSRGRASHPSWALSGAALHVAPRPAATRSSPDPCVRNLSSNWPMEST